MLSYISTFKIINVVADQKMLFSIAASVADAAPATPNGIKTFLANGVSTFFLYGRQFSLMNEEIALFD